MPLKMDINQISQWVHLKLNQKSKCEKNNNQNISIEGSHKLNLIVSSNFTVAVYSWSIGNNFVIDIYCRCLEILCQIA